MKPVAQNRLVLLISFVTLMLAFGLLAFGGAIMDMAVAGEFIEKFLKDWDTITALIFTGLQCFILGWCITITTLVINLTKVVNQDYKLV